MFTEKDLLGFLKTKDEKQKQEMHHRALVERQRDVPLSKIVHGSKTTFNADRTYLRNLFIDIFGPEERLKALRVADSLVQKYGKTRKRAAESEEFDLHVSEILEARKGSHAIQVSPRQDAKKDGVEVGTESGASESEGRPAEEVPAKVAWGMANKDE